MPAVLGTGAARAVDNLQDERIVARRAKREGIKTTELPAERCLLVFVEVLIAKEDHLAFKQSVTDELRELRRWRHGQVDVVQHRAECETEMFELDAVVGSALLQVL